MGKTGEWFIIEVTSTKEDAACLVLERLGYDETFYPTKRVDLRKRFSKSRTNGPVWGRRAWVPGYVFVRSEKISVYWINRTHGHLSMRVLSPGGDPYRVSDEDMARMADVPKRVAALIEDVKRKEREEWERVRPEVGRLARLISGPLEGQVGIVVHLEPEDDPTRATIDLGGFLGKVSVDPATAQKVDA